VQQLATAAHDTGQSATQANRLAATATEAAGQGGAVVSQVVASMSGINESSRRIAEIIGVIDGIAFQTNILALNAAVEAARAGEQGRGFAVVAGEVRTLARRSAEAASQIKQLIESSTEKVNSGAALVGEAGEAMARIVASVGRVTEMIGGIHATVQHQTTEIHSVNNAIVQLDGMTQQNAALVEQSAAASMSLREQTHRLSEALAVFRLEA
jgi:methyl-accepting chemotaxis protein